MEYYVELRPGIRVKRVTSGPQQHFFGYYDKSPWNRPGNLMLAMETEVGPEVPAPSNVASIGVIDVENGLQFNPLVETRAWNWQQGAMAQWIPPDYEKAFLYNHEKKGQLISIVYDLTSHQKMEIPYPIYTIGPYGRYALSLNFARLARLRPGYGYASDVGAGIDELAPDDDGVFLVNMRTGDRQLIISLADLAGFNLPQQSIARDAHWVNHLSLSPGGQRIAFLHRFNLPGGGFSSRLITANRDGTDLYVLADTKVSHYSWYNDYQILAWARKPRITSRLQNIGLAWVFLRHLRKWTRRYTSGWARQTLIGDAYLLFTDGSKVFESIGEGDLITDGHCSFSPNKRWILTDTYPDNARYQTLILYDMYAKKRYDIAKFYAPPKFNGAVRCDLHPRWNYTGTQICVDSAHSGKRQMYVVHLPKQGNELYESFP